MKCFFNNFSSRWWSILSKNFFISPSRSQRALVQLLIFFRAVWQPLLGLNPVEQSRNFRSRTCSITILAACCTILSLGQATPNGRKPPPSLGIFTRLEGLNLNLPALRAKLVLWNHDLGIPSNNSLSVPLTIFPGLDRIDS